MQTVEFGDPHDAARRADTWNEPWFVLRELVQNALDEGGQYELTEEETLPATKGTTVQVPLLPELVKAWDERDVWMQPRYPGVIGNGHPAIKGLYFHGFRFIAPRLLGTSPTTSQTF